MPRAKGQKSMSNFLQRFMRKVLRRFEYRLARDGLGGSLYFLGVPYTWTGDVARAFVFAAREDCLAVINEYPRLFPEGKWRIVETERP